jgi:DNA-directed RNA polymerase sigma subunit (sigma70/sigma32)
MSPENRVRQRAMVKLCQGEQPLTAEELARVPPEARPAAAEVRLRTITEVAALFGLTRARVSQIVSLKRGVPQAGRVRRRARGKRGQGGMGTRTVIREEVHRQRAMVKLRQGEQPLTAEELAQVPPEARPAAAEVRPRPLAEVAALFGLTRQRVHQIISQAAGGTS